MGAAAAQAVGATPKQRPGRKRAADANRCVAGKRCKPEYVEGTRPPGMPAMMPNGLRRAVSPSTPSQQEEQAADAAVVAEQAPDQLPQPETPAEALVAARPICPAPDAGTGEGAISYLKRVDGKWVIVVEGSGVDPNDFDIPKAVIDEFGTVDTRPTK